MNDTVLSTLGLALRAGKLAVGEEPVCAACREHQARVILLARDAADNTADRAGRWARECSAPLLALPYEKSQVGFRLGRSVCAVLAVTDPGFAASLVKKLAASDPARYGETAALLEAQAGRFDRRKRAKAREKKQAQAGRKPGSAPAGNMKHI